MEKKKKIKESVVEKYLIKKVKIIGGLCYKWVSPGNAGVCDRLVMYRGKIIPVETKRPRTKTRALQDWQQNQMRERGITVFTLDTKDAVDWFIDIIMIGK